MKQRKISRGFLYVNEDPDKIRVPEYQMEEYRALAHHINARTEDMYESNHLLRFAGKNNYPTADDLVAHNVKYQMRKYLPMLLFYLEIPIEDTSDTYKEAREYMAYMVNEHVEVVSNEDMEAIDAVSRTVWSNMDTAQRAQLMEPLIGYYAKDEFEGFLLDLGWKKFMSAHENYMKSNYRYGYMPQALFEELEAVWNHLWSIV